MLGEKVDEEERRREVSIRSLSRGPRCAIELLALCKRERDVDNLNNTKKDDSSKKEEKRHKLNYYSFNFHYIRRQDRQDRCPWHVLGEGHRSVCILS